MSGPTVFMHLHVCRHFVNRRAQGLVVARREASWCSPPTHRATVCSSLLYYDTEGHQYHSIQLERSLIRLLVLGQIRPTQIYLFCQRADKFPQTNDVLIVATFVTVNFFHNRKCDLKLYWFLNRKKKEWLQWSQAHYLHKI